MCSPRMRLSCRTYRTYKTYRTYTTYLIARRNPMLGVGFVGCGMIARFHVRALSEIPGTRPVALFDQIPASAAKLQKEIQEQSNIHCDIAPDLDSLVKHKDVNMVIIRSE